MNNAATAPANNNSSAEPAGAAIEAVNASTDEEEAAMVEFEDENGTDGDKALNKVDSVKVKWDPDDLKFFFSEIEDAMELIQIKSQWLKRQVLARALDPLIKAEVKDLLIKKKADAGNDIYKQLKYRLLELFGPKQEDAYEEAANLVLTGKPSALAKRIMVLICDKKKPLEGCCCAKVVSALWKKQLPAVVRAAVAGMDLAADMDTVLRKADDVFASQTTSAAVSAVAAVAVNLDETLPALQAAAITSAKKPKQRDRGHPHPDGPPETACYLHWKFGRSAYTCKKKGSCPWRDFTKPRPPKNNSSN